MNWYNLKEHLCSLAKFFVFLYKVRFLLLSKPCCFMGRCVSSVTIANEAATKYENTYFDIVFSISASLHLIMFGANNTPSTSGEANNTPSTSWEANRAVLFNKPLFLLNNSRSNSFILSNLTFLETVSHGKSFLFQATK